MKELQKGTKVFDVRFGWGEVIRFIKEMDYPIIVEYKDKNGQLEEYDKKGKWISGDLVSLLSLTEYSLEKGGFTPIDKEPPLQVGEMAYFWDDENDNQLVYKIVLYIGDDEKVINSMGVKKYENASREIPQWFLDKQKKHDV
jgi:hypothetical protein